MLTRIDGMACRWKPSPPPRCPARDSLQGRSHLPREALSQTRRRHPFVRTRSLRLRAALMVWPLAATPARGDSRRLSSILLWRFDRQRGDPRARQRAAEISRQGNVVSARHVLFRESDRFVAASPRASVGPMKISVAVGVFGRNRTDMRVHRTNLLCGTRESPDWRRVARRRTRKSAAPSPRPPVSIIQGRAI
jgi:hypothetical protein